MVEDTQSINIPFLEWYTWSYEKQQEFRIISVDQYGVNIINLVGDPVKELLADALRDIVLYHSNKDTGLAEGHKLGGTIPFVKGKQALRIFDKEKNEN